VVGDEVIADGVGELGALVIDDDCLGVAVGLFAECGSDGGSAIVAEILQGGDGQDGFRPAVPGTDKVTAEGGSDRDEQDGLSVDGPDPQRGPPWVPVWPSGGC